MAVVDIAAGERSPTDIHSLAMHELDIHRKAVRCLMELLRQAEEAPAPDMIASLLDIACYRLDWIIEDLALAWQWRPKRRSRAREQQI